MEACATISACLEVYRLTEESCGWKKLSAFFAGFSERTTCRYPVYDAMTGGCKDGLHPDRINENQGAESTLSFLMALLEMQAAKVASVDELHEEMSVPS